LSPWFHPSSGALPDTPLGLDNGSQPAGGGYWQFAPAAPERYGPSPAQGAPTSPPLSGGPERRPRVSFLAVFFMAFCL